MKIFYNIKILQIKTANPLKLAVFIV